MRRAHHPPVSTQGTMHLASQISKRSGGLSRSEIGKNTPSIGQPSHVATHSHPALLHSKPLADTHVLSLSNAFRQSKATMERRTHPSTSFEEHDHGFGDNQQQQHHQQYRTRQSPRQISRQPLSYRHLYHAGNSGDVLKHSILALLASQHLRTVPHGRVFIDTHSGPGGSYDLTHEYARKKQEHKRAISRIHDVARLAALNPHITSYTSLREGNIEFDDAFYEDALYLRLFSPSSDLYHRIPTHDGYGSPGTLNVFSDSKGDRIADVSVPLRTRPHSLLLTSESIASANPPQGENTYIKISSNNPTIPSFNRAVMPTNNYNAVVLSHFIRHMLPIPMSLLPYLAIMNHANKHPTLDSLTTKPNYADILVGDNITKEKAESIKRRQDRDVFDGIFTSSVRLTKDEKANLIRQVVDGAVVNQYVRADSPITDDNAIVSHSLVDSVKSSTAGVIVDESLVYPLMSRAPAEAVLRAKDPRKVKKETQKRLEKARHIMSQKTRRLPSNITESHLSSSSSSSFSFSSSIRTGGHSGGGGVRGRSKPKPRKSTVSSRHYTTTQHRSSGFSRQRPGMPTLDFAHFSTTPTPSGGAIWAQLLHKQQEKRQKTSKGRRHAVLSNKNDPHDEPSHAGKREPSRKSRFRTKLRAERHNFWNRQAPSVEPVGLRDPNSAEHSQSQVASASDSSVQLQLVKYDPRYQLVQSASLFPLIQPTIYTEDHDFMPKLDQLHQQYIHRKQRTLAPQAYAQKLLMSLGLTRDTIRTASRSFQLYFSDRFLIDVHSPLLRSPSSPWIFNSLLQQDLGPNSTNERSIRSQIHPGRQPLPLENDLALFSELHSTEYQTLQTNCSSTFMTKLQLKTLQDQQKQQEEEIDIQTAPTNEQRESRNRTLSQEHAPHVSASSDSDTDNLIADHLIFPPTITNVPLRSGTLGEAVARVNATTILENTISNDTVFARWNTEYFEKHQLKSLEDSRAHNIYIDDHFQRFAMQYNGFQTAQIFMKQMQYYLEFISKLPYSVTHSTEALDRVKQTHTEQYNAFMLRYYNDKVQQYQKDTQRASGKGTTKTQDGSTTTTPDKLTPGDLRNIIMEPRFYSTSLTLCDPAYEVGDEFVSALDLLRTTLEYNSRGNMHTLAIWYPILEQVGTAVDDSSSTTRDTDGNQTNSSSSTATAGGAHQKSSLNLSQVAAADLNRGHFITSLTNEFRNTPKHLHHGLFLQVSKFLVQNYRQEAKKFQEEQAFNEEYLLSTLKRTNDVSERDEDKSHESSSSAASTRWNHEEMYGKHNMDAVVAEIYTGISDKHKQERNRIAMAGNGMLIVSPLLSDELDGSLTELLPWLSTALHRHGPERIHHTVMALDRGLQPDPSRPIADYTLHWM